MIRLAGSSIEVYTSQSFVHGVYVGASYATYNLNHNKGRAQDLTRMYRLLGDDWVEMADLWEGGLNGYYNYYNPSASTTANTAVYDVYRINSVNTTIKFKLFWLPEE